MEFTNRKFGVEIEFLATVDKDAVVRQVRSNGINCEWEGYNHDDHDSHWKMVRDSSCGFELVSPVLSGESGLRQIETVCDALKQVGAKVDRNCGLHVHVDARNLDEKDVAKVFIAYSRYEPLFDALLPVSRRDNLNRFCQSIKNAVHYAADYASDYRRIYRQQYGTRYLKVNLESLIVHGSIEFRQHSGTIDADKINNWVVLMVGFVEEVIKYRMATKQPVMTLASFKTLFGIKSNSEDNRIAILADYLTKRLWDMSKLRPSQTIGAPTVLVMS